MKKDKKGFLDKIREFFIGEARAPEAKGLYAAKASSFFGGRRVEAPEGSLEEYEALYKRDGFVHAAVEQTIAFTVGSGFHLSAKSQRAKRIVERFCEDVGLDQMLIVICRDLLVYGNCYVEKIGRRRLRSLKVLPAVSMRVMRDVHGRVLGYVQRLSIGGIEKTVEFKPDEIIHFKWNVIGSSCYGLGEIAPIYATMTLLNQMDDDMARIIRRYASPRIIWRLPSTATEDQIIQFKTLLDNIEADEDFIAPVDVQPDIIQLDPRGRFENYLVLLNEKMQTGLKTPLLSYLRNATQASAEAMLDYFQQRISMIQRYLKRMIEREIFALVVKSHGLSEVPSLYWGLEKSGVEDLRFADVAQLVQSGVLSPRQARDILRKMGLPVAEEEELGREVEKDASTPGFSEDTGPDEE